MAEDYACIVNTCNRSFSSPVGRGKHLSQGHTDSEMKNALIADIKDTAEETGSVPRSSDVTSSIDTYQRHFGSWNDAVREAGFTPSIEYNIAKSDLIDEIKDLSSELDRTPTRRDMDEIGRFSSDPYHRKFGSWNNALKKAGMSLILDRDVTRQEIIKLIQDLEDQLGGTPSVIEFQENSKYCYIRVRNEFGSWNNALREAGLEPNAVFNGDADRLYYGPNWIEKKKAVIARDAGRCRLTGTKASETKTGALQVHHITPAREFGAHEQDIDTDYEKMNDLSNLICLCPEVHRKVEGKFTDCDHEEFEQKARAVLA